MVHSFSKCIQCHFCLKQQHNIVIQASNFTFQENVDKIKQTQAEIKADQVMFKAEVREQFERVTEMLNQLLQGRNVNNNGAQAMEPLLPANDQDINILGGRSRDGKGGVLNTVEKFNIVEEKSTELPRMNQPRVVSSSCVYNNNIMVTGGFNGQDGLDSIEVLNMNQHPLRWMMFQGKLPFKLCSHVVIVYQDKLYVIGGYNWSEKETSDLIHEVALAAPYTAKVLAKMPEPRQNHRAEIVNGKLFILGGRKTVHNKDAIDSVLVYDFTKKKFKPCPSLPKPVCEMSTVTWGNMIIVISGVDKNNQKFYDVIMYDTETGRSERLPSLNHQRSGHSAVIMHDVIVVLGGWNNEERELNSVESFKMGEDGWREMPGLKQKRFRATAVVKPRN